MTYLLSQWFITGGKPHKKISLNQEQLEGLVDMEKVKKEFECAVEDLKDKFIHQLTVRTSQGNKK